MSVRCARDYALVCGLCVLLNNAILIASDHAGSPLALAMAVSFVVCVVVGYVLHSRISFGRPIALGPFARYSAAMSANLPVAFAALWLCRDLAGFRIELAAPLATVATAFINFVLCRFAVFGRREEGPSWAQP